MKAIFHSNDLDADFEVEAIYPIRDQFTIRVSGYATTFDGVHLLRIVHMTTVIPPEAHEEGNNG